VTYSIGQEVIIEAPSTPYVQLFKGQRATVTGIVADEHYGYELTFPGGRVLGFHKDELAPAEVVQDEINHPSHYTWLPNGLEVIDITEHLNFSLGNAVKYVLRANHKHDEPLTDLRKAAWYINREIERLENVK
jgi:hypothetical protein